MARDFMLSLFPRLLKFRTAPLLPLPVSGHLRIRIRYRESGGWLRGGEWRVAAPVTSCWHLRRRGQWQCLVIQCSEDRGSAVGILPGVTWAECCHQAVVTWWLSPSLWSLLSLWSMTPTCHYHAESGIQPPDIRHITSANLVTVYWKNIQNNIRYKSLYSLTTSRWDRSDCKKSLILMHFLCFTQLRGAWCGPILYL